MELRHYYCMVFLRDEPCTTTDFKCTKYPTIQRANGKYFLYNIWQIVRQLGKWIRLKLLFYKNKPKSISENSLSSLVLVRGPGLWSNEAGANSLPLPWDGDTPSLEQIWIPYLLWKQLSFECKYKTTKRFIIILKKLTSMGGHMVKWSWIMIRNAVLQMALHHAFDSNSFTW